MYEQPTLHTSYSPLTSRKPQRSLSPQKIKCQIVKEDTIQHIDISSSDVNIMDINLTSLKRAARIATEQNKPLKLNYYKRTADLTAFLGEYEDKKEKILIDPDTGKHYIVDYITTTEKMLVAGPEEYTSPVLKIYKSNDAFIIITINSVYIVSMNIKKKRIHSPY